MDRKANDDDKKDKAKKADKSKKAASKSVSSFPAGSAVAEYLSAAEAAAAAAAAVPGGAANSGRRQRKKLAASRNARREASENGISEGGEDSEATSSAHDVEVTPMPLASSLSEAVRHKLEQDSPNGVVTAGTNDPKTPSSLTDEKAEALAGTVSSVLGSKVAMAERSAMRRNKGGAADAGATTKNGGGGSSNPTPEVSSDASALPNSAAAGVAPEPSGAREDDEEDDAQDNISIIPEELSKSLRSIEYGHGSYNSSAVKSGDSSRQGLDLEASTDLTSGGGGSRFSRTRRPLVEAVLVDEDEIARRAYAKAASDVRQQMREMAVSAREVVALPTQVEEGSAGRDVAPSNCWRRRRRLWIASIVVLVVMSVVLGCVFGIAKPGTSSKWRFLAHCNFVRPPKLTRHPNCVSHLLLLLGESSPETIVSGTRPDGSPITFASLSGLSGCPGASGSLHRRGLQKIRESRMASESSACSASTLYAVEDSYAGKTRVLSIDTSRSPAVVVSELVVTDPSSLVEAGLVARDFTNTDIINGDGTLKLDAEAVAALDDGGFWIASEGSGAVNSVEEPLRSPNFIVRVDDAGVVNDAVFLPDALNAEQAGFGFEGLDVDGPYVVVAFQRPWLNDTHNRIGIYNTETLEWKFTFYAVAAPESPDGGWVGISEIALLGNGTFLVMERDSKNDDEARVKRIYKTRINYDDISTLSVLDKALVLDVLPLVQEAAGGLIPEKVEGMAFDGFGNLWIVTDNDGGDEETYFLKVLTNASLSSF
jgi:Esterase-like activity of phytase